MTGRIIDLARTPFSPLGPTALDANVVIDRLLASFGFAHRRNAIRAEAFFQSLHAANERAILTPTAYNEVIHAAVKSVYREARPAHREVLTSRTRQRGGFSWLDLYKLEPSILKEHVTMLRDMGNGFSPRMSSFLTPVTSSCRTEDRITGWRCRNWSLATGSIRVMPPS